MDKMGNMAMEEKESLTLAIRKLFHCPLSTMLFSQHARRMQRATVERPVGVKRSGPDGQWYIDEKERFERRMKGTGKEDTEEGKEKITEKEEVSGA